LKKAITLIAALVAVLAVTSGAFAAKQYMITSSKQIKKGTISLSNLSRNAHKALQGAAGPAGLAGPVGPTGAVGPTGNAGPTGATGATGQAGATGATGMTGLDGVNGRDGLNGLNGRDGQAGPQGLQGAAGLTGATGPIGPQGVAGPQGPKGDKGDSGLAGAYYSVAYYDNGDTNAGAIATVACKTQTDTAISGGVQMIGLGDNNDQTTNVPVSSSFPGRMDWDGSVTGHPNTPKPDRLDGWIVQFGGNSNGSNLGDPTRVKVWALCVPGLNVPVTPTYTQSIDG
jgi:hypothetical protein